MFLFAILEFLCIECFAYALASLVLLYSYVCSRTPPLLYPFPFFIVLLSWICYLPNSHHSCKALLLFVLFSLTLLSLTLLVVPPCLKVVVMTLTFTDKLEISFLLFTIRICAVFTQK